MNSLIHTPGSKRFALTALLLGVAVWISLTTCENIQNHRHPISLDLELTPVQTGVARTSLKQMTEDNIRLFNAAKAHNWQIVRLELQAIQQANRQLKSVPASARDGNRLEQDIATLTQAVHVQERPVVLETSTRLLIDTVNQANSLQRR